MTVYVSKVLILMSFSALRNTSAGRVYQLGYSGFAFNSCNQFKVVTFFLNEVDSLLSSTTQDDASRNVIIRISTSALCSTLNEISWLNFTWLLIETKPFATLLDRAI